jgi:alkylation response protein AidB-like acyl-CoA dehydrogenase
MDFDFPTDDDPRRSELRAWLAEHPSPTSAELHEVGLLVPHWPRPWGVEADPIHQLIIDEELKAAGVRETSVSTNPIGVGWAAPTILLAGTEWQKERFLPQIFSGEEQWCQLFSEPDSGSDLASLATRAVGMATSTSSTVQKSGRAVPIIRNTESSLREPTRRAET